MTPRGPAVSDPVFESARERAEFDALGRRPACFDCRHAKPFRGRVAGLCTVTGMPTGVRHPQERGPWWCPRSPGTRREDVPRPELLARLAAAWPSPYGPLPSYGYGLAARPPRRIRVTPPSLRDAVALVKSLSDPPDPVRNILAQNAARRARLGAVEP